MLAALGLVFGIVAEVQQRVVTLRGFHNDVAAASAVSAGGPSARDELLPAKGHAAITSVTGFDSNFRFIDEHLSFLF